MHPLYKKVAGIDVHKRVLYVVVAEAPGSEPQYQRARYGATQSELSRLAEWLQIHKVDTVVMESTAMYWRPVWAALESRFRLLLANARSNPAPRGRKRDYADAERLTRRLVSDDLRLSFVPDSEQRDWRALTRQRVQNSNDRTRLRNRIECLLEEAQIKITSLLSDVLGVSGRHMLRALADGQTDPEKLAGLAVGPLRARPEELAEAFRGHLRPTQRMLLGQHLDVIETLDRQVEQINQMLGQLLAAHQEVMARLCTVPGISTTAAEQIIAEVGPAATTFASAGQLCSWVGPCPGRNESAGVSTSNASPKGNRWMRRLLVQCAWAAVRTKGSFFQSFFERLKVRIGIPQAIWATAHRLLRNLWRILHLRDTYQERGPLGQDPASIQRRFRRIAKQMAAIGFQVNVTLFPAVLP